MVVPTTSSGLEIHDIGIVAGRVRVGGSTQERSRCEVGSTAHVAVVATINGRCWAACLGCLCLVMSIVPVGLAISSPAVHMTEIRTPVLVAISQHSLTPLPTVRFGAIHQHPFHGQFQFTPLCFVPNVINHFLVIR